MLLGTRVHVPEVITGLIGVGFIGASVWSSLRHRKNHPVHYVTPWHTPALRPTATHNKT